MMKTGPLEAPRLMRQRLRVGVPGGSILRPADRAGYLQHLPYPPCAGRLWLPGRAR